MPVGTVLLAQILATQGAMFPSWSILSTGNGSACGCSPTGHYRQVQDALKHDMKYLQENFGPVYSQET